MTSGHEHSGHAQPFTKEELVYLEMSNQTSDLQGHHHHHHHHHVEYKQPEQLTTELGLFALKKANAINPNFLRVREARLLEQVNPGTITYMTNIFFMLSTGAYSMYVWRGLGFKGFASKAVVPLVGLIGAWKATMIGYNTLR